MLDAAKRQSQAVFEDDKQEGEYWWAEYI